MPNNAVTLSDYLGHLLKEITNARVSADRHSVEVAKLYSKDEIMKHFPSPRFTIADMELDIPIVISEVDFRVSKKLVLDQQKFVHKIKEELNSVLRRYNNHDDLIAASEMSDVVLDIYALYNKMTRLSDENDILNVLHENYPLILNKTLRRGMNTISSQSIDESVKNVQIVDLSLTQIHNFVLNHFVVEESKLGGVWIDPSTNAVKMSNNINHVIKIKMRINEEQISMQEITDNEGNISSVLSL